MNINKHLILLVAICLTLCSEYTNADSKVSQLPDVARGMASQVRATPTPRPGPVPALHPTLLPVTEQCGVGTSFLGNTPLYWDAYVIPTGTHPAVLVIHGGGFKDGEPGPASVAQDLNAAGFNVFAIDYRLAPPHTDMPQQVNRDEGYYPEQTDDVATAIRAARAGSTAASAGKVTGKVGAVGGSAGASHAAYTAAAVTPSGDMLDAAVLLSGAYDFHDPASLLDVRCTTFADNVINYVNSSDASNGGALDLASPYRRFTSASAPVFVIATNLDPMPPQQYQILTTILNAVGAPNQTLLITEAPGTDGCTRHAFEYWDDVRSQAILFLDRNLR
jgi:acetyl esterase/lipase